MFYKVVVTVWDKKNKKAGGGVFSSLTQGAGEMQGLRVMKQNLDPKSINTESVRLSPK